LFELTVAACKSKTVRIRTTSDVIFLIIFTKGSGDLGRAAAPEIRYGN
jgi:hypothetical protein